MTVLHLSHVCFTLLLFSSCRSGAQEADPNVGPILIGVLGRRPGRGHSSFWAHESLDCIFQAPHTAKVTTDPFLYNRTGCPSGLVH